MLLITKLEKDAFLPTHKHEGDAGLDFYVYEDIIIKPKSFGIVRTGISIYFDWRFVGLLMAKSRSDYIIGAGVVDNNYQGEILFKVFNIKDENLVLNRGEAVGQMIVVYNFEPVFREISKKEFYEHKTNRGIDGGIVSQLTKQ